MASYTSLLKGSEDDVERCSLQKMQMTKTKKKSNYGSLHSNKNETTIQTSTAFIVNYKHKLKAGETLQGISLKYGVSIENIKRANRLWSNDLAFVKEILLVPIDKDKLSELDFVNMNDIESTSISNANVNQNGNASLKNGEEKHKTNDEYKDYLSKFDTFISQSKLKLKSLESNTNLSEYTKDGRKNSNHNGFNSAYELEDDNESDDLFKSKSRKNFNKTNTSIGTNGAENSFDFGQDELSQSSSNTSNNRFTSNNNGVVGVGVGNQHSSSQPELLITSPSQKHTNYYNSNHNLINTSRARLAQENLQRLEREKDDLYEL